LEPHKNYPRLIRAFSLLPSRPSLPRTLVICGPAGKSFHECERMIEELGLHLRVILTGHVGGDQLAALYGRAHAFVFPSLMEGFGIPAVEAISLGLPLACARAGSLPEVVGDAALMFDPYSVDEISQCMGRISEDAVLRDRLRLLGPARAAQLTWHRSAERMLEVVSEAVNSRRR